jgi:hypothetical protein
LLLNTDIDPDRIKHGEETSFDVPRLFILDYLPLATVRLSIAMLQQATARAFSPQ